MCNAIYRFIYGTPEKPRRACSQYVVDHFLIAPCQIFLVMTFILVTLSGLSIFGLKALSVKEVDNAWTVWNAKSSNHYMALLSARSKSDMPQVMDGVIEEKFSQITVLYKTNEEGTGTMFTSARMREVCLFEQQVMNAGADKAESVLEIIYGLKPYRGAPIIRWHMDDDPTHWNCSGVAQSYIDRHSFAVESDVFSAQQGSRHAQYLDKTFDVTGDTPVLRTRFHVSPEKEEAVLDMMFTYLKSESGFRSSRFEGESDQFLPHGGIRYRIYSPNVDEFKNFINMDLAMSGFSFCMIGTVMYIRTRSSIITLAWFVSIMSSMTLGAAIYRLLCPAFEYMHLMVVYLVIITGTNNAFMLHKTWSHICDEYPQEFPGAYQEHTLKEILVMVYVRIQFALFVTTAFMGLFFAMCSNSTSVPMRTFAWFAATVTTTNYLLTLFYMPTAILVYHLRFQGKKWCCPLCGPRQEVMAERKGTVARVKKTSDTNTQLSTTPARTALIKKIFSLADRDMDDRLSMEEMYVIAKETGFEGSKSAWEKTYIDLLKRAGKHFSSGCDLQTLANILDDESENGCYLEDDELKDIVQKLEADFGVISGMARNDSVENIFMKSDKNTDGFLDEDEMWVIASLVGYEDIDVWSALFNKLCTELQQDDQMGFEVDGLSRFLDDEGKTDDELLEMLEMLDSMSDAENGTKKRKRGAGSMSLLNPANWYDNYITLVLKRRGKFRLWGFFFIALSLMVGLLAVMLVTLLLTPPRAEEQWLMSHHMLHSVRTFIADQLYFPGIDQFATITFTWGLLDFDSHSVNPYQPDVTEGYPNFDPDFRLGTGDAQKFFLSTCNMLENLKCELPGCKNEQDPDRKLVMREFDDQKTLSCFVDDFRNWEYGTNILPEGSAFDNTFHHFRDVVNPDKFSSKALKTNYKEDIGFIDHKLKYISIRMLTTLPKAQPYRTGKPVQDLVMRFAQERIDHAPPELKSLTVGCETFVRYDSQEGMLNSLLSSMMGTIAFGPLLLLFLFKNWVIAIYTWMSFLFVGFCTLTLCAVSGWDLGTAEAIAAIMCVALSVDYPVHIATIYIVAGKEYAIVPRQDRAEVAIRTMGSAIFLSAFTVMGAVLFMYAAFLNFIHKMATLIIISLIFSLIFSLTLLFPLFVVGGPIKGFGDLVTVGTIWKCIRKSVRSALEYV